MANLHIKTGDTVAVLSGDDKGKTGEVIAVSPSEGKVIVNIKERAELDKINAEILVKNELRKYTGHNASMHKDERARKAQTRFTYDYGRSRR